MKFIMQNEHIKSYLHYQKNNTKKARLFTYPASLLLIGFQLSSITCLLSERKFWNLSY